MSGTAVLPPSVYGWPCGESEGGNQPVSPADRRALPRRHGGPWSVELGVAGCTELDLGRRRKRIPRVQRQLLRISKLLQHHGRVASLLGAESGRNEQASAAEASRWYGFVMDHRCLARSPRTADNHRNRPLIQAAAAICYWLAITRLAGNINRPDIYNSPEPSKLMAF